MIVGAILWTAGALAPIADVRVGDDGPLARVEIVCGGPCFAEPLGDQSFLIRAASGDFTADVAAQSLLVRTITMQSGKEGSSLTVDTVRTPRSVSAAQCGPNRLCFDFDLSRPKPTQQRLTITDIDEDMDRLFERTRLATLVPGDIAQASMNEKGCAQAETDLADDAWNLFAYRTVAVCRARAGDPDAAQLLARLDAFSWGKKQPRAAVPKTTTGALR